jgi:hypothetical protein
MRNHGRKLGIAQRLKRIEMARRLTGVAGESSLPMIARGV